MTLPTLRSLLYSAHFSPISSQFDPNLSIFPLGSLLYSSHFFSHFIHNLTTICPDSWCMASLINRLCNKYVAYVLYSLKEGSKFCLDYSILPSSKENCVIQHFVCDSVLVSIKHQVGVGVLFQHLVCAFVLVSIKHSVSVSVSYIVRPSTRRESAQPRGEFHQFKCKSRFVSPPLSLAVGYLAC